MAWPRHQARRASVLCVSLTTVRWLLTGLIFLYLAQFSTAAPAAPPSADEVQVLRDAEVRVILDGQPRPAAPARLPYAWDRFNGAIDGQAQLVLHFDLAPDAGPMALYVPRLGNSFAIRLNGHALAHSDPLDWRDIPDTAAQPYYFVLPREFLQARSELQIDLKVHGGSYGGLSTVHIGPPGELRPSYLWRYFLEVSGRRLLVALTVLLGLLGLLFWWRQRDPAYLSYGLSELLWSVLTGRSWFDLSDWSPLWAGLAFHLPLNLATPLLWRFVLAVHGANSGWLPRLLNTVLLLAVPAAMVSATGRIEWFVPLWQGILVLTTLAVTARVTLGLRRDSSWEQKVLSAALLLLMISAIRDYVMFRYSATSYEVVSWTRFAWVGMGLSFAWLIAERMRRTTFSLKDLNASLVDRLAMRDVELHAAFERERHHEKARGAAEERQRLMRDLHDGLGSHLVGAMHMAQRPGVSGHMIAGQLADAVDQLKMTVDAMHETDGDIASLLGAARYRLNHRLQSAGIELTWDVGSLPPVAEWGPRQSYQLQMIIFEIFSNMIQHSGSHQAKLCARLSQDAGARRIDIEIVDDGRGFDVARALQAPGKGLSNIRSRAAELQCILEIDSRPGATRFFISIAVHAAAIGQA